MFFRAPRVVRISGIFKLMTFHSRTSNFEFRTSKLTFGFTLVEMLVVVGILSFAVGSSMLFLTSIIKGGNQASVTAEVKQNGQIIFDSLERQIRNGIDAQLLPEPNSLKIIRSGLYPLYIKCFPASVGPPARNGLIGTVVKASDPTSDSEYTSLSQDTDPVSGVDIQCAASPPEFNVIPATPTAPAIVTISFVVNQGINAPSRQDFVARAEFRTTISLRQY